MGECGGAAKTSRTDHSPRGPRDADRKTIKPAFRNLAHTYHPDRSTESDAQERFREITESYAVRSDPDKRTDYDRCGAADLAGASVEDLLAGLEVMSTVLYAVTEAEGVLVT
ncbi:hypothetical protein TR51_10505 [Kitasatospora griseola]|uniref:J domain-containing protein n=1 Tax=Kitasatospora griseola TaxID=2064 RepID=A0A0D0PQ53_KITGR|nr:DnaJ domain-containing protein [Kitasatospora griseola]KIQ64649.1 hypothetical protein TR51_10505 [Kitasatospora griseola]